MNKYFIYLCFKISKSNFTYTGWFNSYLFRISTDKLEIITVFKSIVGIDDLKNFTDSQDEIERSKGLGFLLDIIALGTELITSYKSEGFVFNSTDELQKKFFKKQDSFEEFYKALQKQRRYNCGEMGEWPIIIREGTQTTFTEEILQFKKFLLDHLIAYKNFNNKLISLLNYWRKGIVFDELWFWDESYLNYYKVLDFYIEKFRQKLGFFKKLYFLIINRKLKLTENEVRLMLTTMGFRPNKDNIRLVFELREIRINWDIAHPSLKKTQGKNAVTQRESSYNLSYYFQLIQYWDYIKEISRMLLLRDTDLKNVNLFSDGGSFVLKKNE